MDIFGFIQRFSPTPKREGVDFSVADIESLLLDNGLSCHERALYRQLRGLGISKSATGYYGRAEVAVVIGWYQYRDRFTSMAQYCESVGKKIYAQAKEHYQ